MAEERTDFGFKRIVCDCTACVRNCYFLPGYLIPADLQRIADYLNEADIERFAFENLLASPGAIVVAEGECFAIPTIVPTRRPDGTCRFLCDLRLKIAGVPSDASIHCHAILQVTTGITSMRG